MIDVYNPTPDDRRHRWWRKPSPTKEYREIWDKLWGDKDEDTTSSEEPDHQTTKE